MIGIEITWTETQQVEEIVVQGHAEFAEPGEDIVCAGVSAVVGVLGIATELSSLPNDLAKAHEGYFCWRAGEQGLGDIGLQCCAQAVVASLEEISDHYQGFVTLRKNSF